MSLLPAVMGQAALASAGWHHGEVADEAVPTAELFLDERGSLLRVRWDAASRQLAIAVWRDGVCVATHRLDHTDTVRLSSLLTQAWIERLRHNSVEAE